MIYSSYKKEYPILWKQISDVIFDLVESEKLIVQTNMDYVVGYILKSIVSIKTKNELFNFDIDYIVNILTDLVNNSDIIIRDKDLLAKKLLLVIKPT